MAVRSIREGTHPDVRVGITNLITDVLASSNSADDVAAAERTDANNNLMFLAPTYLGRYPALVHDLYDRYGLDSLIRPGDLDLISIPTDFAGVNHYHQMVVSADPSESHLGATITHAEPTATSLGWSVKPESLINVLCRVSEEFTDLPLYVTESGASFDDEVDQGGHVVDVDRIRYLHGYFGAAADAFAAGVDVRGYFVWSLLDNFEWGEGYSQRFGLTYIDYETQTRIPKASAEWYRIQIARHSGQPVHGAEKNSGIVT